jgi:hypothetical protein
MNDKGRRRRSVSELNRESGGANSPSQFMRARRPELFSDSKIRTETQLNRDALDYHLSILTSKKQEIDFEHFCRRIAEQEICPNLVAQTGPTGGGDSKVDSETYPVSQRISTRWYQGIPNNSEEERWAFAFSAKREWCSKVRADVESIASTKRGYKLVYFITNQYVKDKSRAQVEDQLTGKHGVRVCIHDRTWLLKCIFEHGREAIAIETLHLDAPSSNSRLVGPTDLAKAQRLEAIEARISDTSRYHGVEYQLVEDCLSAAILSRNLEKPRVETEGRFSRAERIADSVGIPQQRLRVAYYRAWTAYWWYEDWNEFLSHYNVVEPLALASSLADDIELAGNLWRLLYSACSTGHIDGTASGLKDRRQRLDVALSRLSQDVERPNNALSARTDLAFLEMLTVQKDKAGPVIKQLIKIASESEGLLDYPVEPFARIVDELGTLFADVPEYDELIESVVDLTQRRVGQQQSGRMLLTRGLQKLRASRIYDAIRLFGRAQQKLAMREAREELTHALFAGGLAYEGAGLLWAARANVLASTNLVHAELREGGPIPDNALLCARKLVWHELQLGRVAHVLQWIEFAGVLASNQGLDSGEREKFLSEREAQDLALALLLLKADVRGLMELRFLPDVLERLGLPYSRMALLFALGYESLLFSEGSIPTDESSDSLLSTFTNFMKQQAVADLPPGPTALGGGSLTFVSPVLGCRVIARAEPDYESQRLAERILAGIEALFATSLDEEIFPYREELAIDVRRDVAHQGPPKITEDASLGNNVSIVHAGSISDSHNTNGDWFLDILTVVITRLVMIPQPEAYMKRVFGEESGLARSVNFTESGITMENILGHNAKTRIPDWNTESDLRAYIPKRTTAWHRGLFAQETDTVRTELNIGVGEIPKELLDRGKTKHTERRVLGLIDMPLWDKAKWKGVLYIWPVDMDSEPWMALGFEDGAVARAIFQGWRATIGSIDNEDRIRISILTGVDRSSPDHYTVVVGSNLLESERGPRVKQFVSVSRIHRMEPSTSRNLTAFVNRYERIGTYRLMPAQVDLKEGKSKPYPDLAIQKRKIRVSPAWTIEEHDPDGVGILPEDKPIIPEGITDAPVLKVLERKNKRTNQF